MPDLRVNFRVTELAFNDNRVRTGTDRPEITRDQQPAANLLFNIAGPSTGRRTEFQHPHPRSQQPTAPVQLFELEVRPGNPSFRLSLTRKRVFSRSRQPAGTGFAAGDSLAAIS